jgi:dolichol-phosphate mannosyltransferase
MTPDALVIIPAYNEEASIAEVVRRATRYAPVLVVDDGSRDRTGEIARALPDCAVLRHETNTHIAQGIRDGFRYALDHGVRYAVTMDAGMSHDPGALPALLEYPDADLVLSYRAERRNVPLARRALSRAARFAVNLALGGASYRDVTSGYRRYSRRAMQAVLAAPMACHSFDFHFEALAVVHYAGLSIGEVPITYTFTNSSLSRSVLNQAIRTWWRLVRGLHRLSPIDPSAKH